MSKFVFHEELCIQCGGCTTACDNLHGTGDEIHLREVSYSWSGEYPNVHMMIEMNGCRHCTEALCLVECPTEAIYKAETGAVRVKREACIGCGKCRKVCPFGAPQLDSSRKMVICSLCETPVCVWNCPSKALEIV